MQTFFVWPVRSEKKAKSILIKRMWTIYTHTHTHFIFTYIFLIYIFSKVILCYKVGCNSLVYAKRCGYSAISSWQSFGQTVSRLCRQCAIYTPLIYSSFVPWVAGSTNVFWAFMETLCSIKSLALLYLCKIRATSCFCDQMFSIKCFVMALIFFICASYQNTMMTKKWLWGRAPLSMRDRRCRCKWVTEGKGGLQLSRPLQERYEWHACE